MQSEPMLESESEPEQVLHSAPEPEAEPEPKDEPEAEPEPVLEVVLHTEPEPTEVKKLTGPTESGKKFKSIKLLYLLEPSNGQKEKKSRG